MNPGLIRTSEIFVVIVVGRGISGGWATNHKARQLKNGVFS
jgi:hypothetical protein